MLAELTLTEYNDEGSACQRGLGEKGACCSAQGGDSGQSVNVSKE